MQWITIIIGVLKVVADISAFIARRNDLDSARAIIISEGLQQTFANLEKAKNVKQEIYNHPDGDFSNRVREKYTRPDE